MTRSPELTNLFSRLASHLQTLDHQSNEKESYIDQTISNLNQSLNLNEDSRVGVLDAALSLMCFKAPQVFDSMIEYLVKTIVTVLSSSVTCKAIKFGNEEVLQIGSSICAQSCVELIEISNQFIEKLGAYELLSSMLMHAVVKAAALTSRYRFRLPFTPILDVKSIDGRSLSVSKLLSCLPTDLSVESQEIPTRLLFWYLDPLALKDDVSNFLEDTIRRPFMCPSAEFYERTQWRNVVVCLVLSPTMFIETRKLLHNWFLMTGVSSILELLVGFVWAVLDLISRPTWWGIPVELASKLPFSDAYFPFKRLLFRTLAGPLTLENLACLVESFSEPHFPVSKNFDPGFKTSALKAVKMDHRSAWALAINFPHWFYFACSILFSGKNFQDNFELKISLGDKEECDTVPPSAAAARYIAWILNPVSNSHQDLLFHSLIKVSEIWTREQNNLRASDNSKKYKNFKLHASCLEKDPDCRIIKFCLKEFQNICIQHSNVAVNGSVPRGSSAILIQKVPLGIIIGCLNLLTENGCELLLYFAATGKVTEPLNGAFKHGSRDLAPDYSEKEALAGACLVFRLTDIIESISTSVFETEETVLSFVHLLKLKASKYLISCITRLIELNRPGNGTSVLMDLPGRLAQWRSQGREVTERSKELDDIAFQLDYITSSL